MRSKEEGVNEQSRARYPDEEGFVDRDGVRIHWEVYGSGEPTILLVPPWMIVHSRVWKMQIPYLARHARVVTFDPRGNGKSDRPKDGAAHSDGEHVKDALAVLDATRTGRCVVVSFSKGAECALRLAADHPERVAGAAFIGPMFPVSRRSMRWRLMGSRLLKPIFDWPTITTKGWGKFNAQYWRKQYPDFVEWWIKKVFNEPHSTKQIEDAIGWGLETDAETLVASAHGSGNFARKEQLELAKRVKCPVLVIHGTRDRICPYDDGEMLAETTGGKLVTIPDGSHGVQCRQPVPVNLALREFACPPKPAPARASRKRRALYISSPIGLGHAQRDLAVARELRKLHPDLEIDWLAQDPVTRVLAAENERIHPASALLANESRHIESECGEHDLHAFQAIRRMDEILIANFMLFHDLVREDAYDLWIGDEAWELDYYLHENPGEKKTPFAWFTDFVGWLPMPDGGTHEGMLTTDYNAEMVRHIDRHPQVRDRALFVGNADDIVPDRLGPQLPLIRDWTEKHFEFPGYICGFDPRQLGDRAALRHQLGYRDDEQVCIVTVGGSGVGRSLIERIVAAFPLAKRRVPALRMIVVSGPRLDPASLPQHPGLEMVAYVHNLYRHLAACDLAIVQGGLSTTMELTAAKRPFLYFPLQHHFEQNFHVRHRLERYRAGRCMSFAESSPEVIAAAIAEEIGRTVDYRDVETDGARRAAARIAEML
jgi:pimeloyl-ACP methyl ester carboxylesterase/predicted glycosyltransferase